MLDVGVERLVFSSTCAMYGIRCARQSTRRTPPLRSIAYGDTKRMVERALHWYGRAHGLRSVALRYFNAAGADPEGEIGERHDPETHLVPLAILAALGRGAPLGVNGNDYPTPDGTAIRDYVHVTDLADAHVRALGLLLAGEDRGPDGWPLPLNLGTGRSHSVLEVIGAVEAATGRAVPRTAQPRRPGDPAELVADARAARELLGWTPRHSDLETIVATALAWHRATDAVGS